jgi:septal ring factor EnvC (AmiA/AmiB activator)
MERKFESHEKTISNQKKQIHNYESAIKDMQKIIDKLKTNMSNEELKVVKAANLKLQADLEKANKELKNEERIVTIVINAIKEFFNGTN